MKGKARILNEVSVGLTPEISAALSVATQFSGLTPSAYGRMAILERLVRENFLRHPGIAAYETINGAVKQQAATIQPAE